MTTKSTILVRLIFVDLFNKTAELSQRRPRDAPNIWVH